MDCGDARAVTPIALTIAGSDSGGGAGVQADLRTFAALGVYGASAITALTAQNTLGVASVELASAKIVAAQIEAVRQDFDVAAIKIGMLGSAEIANVVGEALRFEGASNRPFVVFDPVMTASSGDALSGADFAEALRSHLLPRVDCLTPNLAEAAALLGMPRADNESEMARQGADLLALGPAAVLMKGGHLDGAEAVDLLVSASGVRRFAAPRLASKNLHGTGCTLSSAIAAHVALGADLATAVERAKAFVRDAIERAENVVVGRGVGPVLQIALASRA